MAQKKKNLCHIQVYFTQYKKEGKKMFQEKMMYVSEWKTKKKQAPMASLV